MVSSTRTLSTGLERSAVEALDRPGTVWEFKIPSTTISRWKFEGTVQSLRDLDKVTGVVNEELRFSPRVASELQNFLVK